MQITQVISFLAAAIVGVVATPGQQPPSPPPIKTNFHPNPCSNGLTPYCCTGLEDLGCSPWSGTCTGIIECCPENEAVSKPRSLKASVIKTYSRLILNVLMTGCSMLRLGQGRPYLGHDCWSQLLLTGQPVNLPLRVGASTPFEDLELLPLGLIACLSRKENESEILKITIVS